jgi:hypothetical protein
VDLHHAPLWLAMATLLRFAVFEDTYPWDLASTAKDANVLGAG